MAQDQQIVKISREWTELTNAPASEIVFLVQGGAAYIAYTASAAAPTAEIGALYASKKGERDLISALTPLAGANRVWAKSAANETTAIFVDHA